MACALHSTQIPCTGDSSIHDPSRIFDHDASMCDHLLHGFGVKQRWRCRQHRFWKQSSTITTNKTIRTYHERYGVSWDMAPKHHQHSKKNLPSENSCCCPAVSSYQNALQLQRSDQTRSKFCQNFSRNMSYSRVRSHKLYWAFGLTIFGTQKIRTYQPRWEQTC